jgi:hypothetical protein
MPVLAITVTELMRCLLNTPGEHVPEPRTDHGDAYDGIG